MAGTSFSSGDRPPRVAIVGSFTRDTEGLRRTYQELTLAGCQVISPRGVDFDTGKFVRLPGEDMLSANELERAHLSAIVMSDFVWLHAPSGYVGNAGYFEIGFAAAHQKVIFSKNDIDGEPTIAQFVRLVTSVFEGLLKLQK